MIFLDRDSFTTWLQHQAPETVVGVSQDGMSCPLATYLQAQGAQTAFVGNGTYQSGHFPLMPLPRWAESFVRAVDGRPDALTAERALAILTHIPAATLADIDSSEEYAFTIHGESATMISPLVDTMPMLVGV